MFENLGEPKSSCEIVKVIVLVNKNNLFLEKRQNLEKMEQEGLYNRQGRQTESDWEVRLVNSTLRRESRSHGEVTSKITQLAKETLPNQMDWKC